MIGVMIVPTGIGCEIGGHAGDANPACKLIASCCDKLITHPNVVNASYANEMPENVLYVEGSMLDRFLNGDFGLKESYRNKILIAINEMNPEIINMVHASVVTIGCDIEIMLLDTELKMHCHIEDGKAPGSVTGWGELVKQSKEHNFDALAIYTKIDCHRDVSLNYYKNGGVNPWGGIEAITSRLISNELFKPVAHSPVEATDPNDKELYDINLDRIVDCRISPEAVSTNYLHCILKGLNKAPQIGNKINVDDIDFMISPMYCWGKPHNLCQGRIPIIFVRENVPAVATSFPKEVMDNMIVVENYLEAAGWIMALKAGVYHKTVRRPLDYLTK